MQEKYESISLQFEFPRGGKEGAKTSELETDLASGYTSLPISSPFEAVLS